MSFYQATVLEMCMVGSAIANEGALMQPYLVDGVYNANGERSFSAAPVKLKQAIDKETAARVMTVLEGVVTEGTGTRAAIEGVKVAGKTGTSERGDGDTDSWFVRVVSFVQHTHTHTHTTDQSLRNVYQM